MGHKQNEKTIVFLNSCRGAAILCRSRFQTVSSDNSVLTCRLQQLDQHYSVLLSLSAHKNILNAGNRPSPTTMHAPGTECVDRKGQGRTEPAYRD